MVQVCVPEGNQCYDCADYAGAFACLDKIKISDMAVATELEIQTAVESPCEQVLIPAEFVPCNGTPFTQAISLSTIISGATGSPLGATFWTPIDFGDSYGGCWYKFNTDLVITRADFSDFFTAAGIAGDTFTIPGMQGKYPMGAGTGYATVRQILGSSNSTVTLGCNNLPSCQIQINDPGHSHVTNILVNKNADDGNDFLTIDRDGQDPEEIRGHLSNSSATGITATHRVGDNNNGTPVGFSVRPWSVAGVWYIKLSNNCA